MTLHMHAMGRTNMTHNLSAKKLCMKARMNSAQLLTGGSTNRQEYASREDLERRAEELDELARRRDERLLRT
jgi:hypothetical protein